MSNPEEAIMRKFNDSLEHLVLGGFMSSVTKELIVQRLSAILAEEIVT